MRGYGCGRTTEDCGEGSITCSQGMYSSQKRRGMTKTTKDEWISNSVNKTTIQDVE